MKLGIIRCMQTEDYCPGTTDFAFIREKKGAFEGVEGAGKSTALKNMARELGQEGADVLVTREPGGSGLGKVLRTLLLDPGGGPMPLPLPPAFRRGIPSGIPVPLRGK